MYYGGIVKSQSNHMTDTGDYLFVEQLHAVFSIGWIPYTVDDIPTILRYVSARILRKVARILHVIQSAVPYVHSVDYPEPVGKTCHHRRLCFQIMRQGYLAF
jgi:hypothetical protein